MRRNRSALPQRSRERIWWIVGVCGVAEELHLPLAPPPSSFSLPEEDERCRFFMYFLTDSWYSSRKHRNCKCLPSTSKFSMHPSWVVSVGGERGTKVCCPLEMLSPLKWLLQIQGLLEVCCCLQSMHPSAASDGKKNAKRLSHSISLLSVGMIYSLVSLGSEKFLILGTGFAHNSVKFCTLFGGKPMLKIKSNNKRKS